SIHFIYIFRNSNPICHPFLQLFCSETSPSSLGSVATTDGNKSAGSTSEEPSSGSIVSMPLSGGGVGSSSQKGLLLKLPDTLGSGSSGLPSASVETPDLSSLINQNIEFGLGFKILRSGSGPTNGRICGNFLMNLIENSPKSKDSEPESREVIKNGSPLIAVPQTADVLKTALELRENLDVGRQRCLGGGDMVRFSFGQSDVQSPGVLLKLHPFFNGGGDKSATLNFSLTELQSPSKDLLNVNYSTELMQNSLRITPTHWTMEQQRAHHHHHQHQSIQHTESTLARHSPSKIRRFDENRPNATIAAPLLSAAQCATPQPPPTCPARSPASDQAPSSFMYVPVKVGDQMVYVPMLGAAAAEETIHDDRDDAVNEPLLQQQPAASTTPAVSISRSGGQLGSSGRQSSTPLRIGQDYHQQFMEELHRKNSCGSIASPGLGPPEEEKRKESLERNKEAAWRYRKRKKEERWLLEEKSKTLQSENMELITQVSLLKSELARVNQLLNEHKNCPLMTSSTTVDYGGSPQCGKSAAHRGRSAVASSSSSAATPGSIVVPGADSETEDVKPVILAPTTVQLSGGSAHMPQHFGLVPSPFGAIVSHLTSNGAPVASTETSIFDNSHFDAR
uniref:BZIP domain-containing protein n=1 Tax=Romanomermis culicivorax TaxID=13658 RepID=A0A915JSM4_ROMCU